jgi:FAD:protein FMN transferase
MNSYSKSEVRRCRPLLGTFVEIKAAGIDNSALTRAVDKAFAQIERAQSLMSVHDDASELSRVNAESFLRPVKVSDETFAVLERGLDIARASAGAFDFTIAPVLAGWGLLPAHLRRRAQGDWRNISLQRGQRVRFSRPLAIDLGGIAKGFAVDTAIALLRACKVTSASVNAGGDLRVFGPDESRIHLRHPVSAQSVASPISLRNAALATSSPCFTRRPWRGRVVSHLIDPMNRRAITRSLSVSVRAPECWRADALTKVVLNTDTATAERLLETHGAEALILAA